MPARSGSISSEKLEILVEALDKLPKDMLSRIKTFELTWCELGTDPTVVPIIKATFKE